MNNIHLEAVGLTRRFIAFLIDLVMVYLVFPILIALPIIVIASIFFPTSNILGAGFTHVILPIVTFVIIVTAIAAILMPLLYYTYLTSSFRQATLGQRFMNIYVVRLNQTKIGVRFSLMRFLVWVLPSIIIETAFTVIDINLDELTLETISFIFFIAWYIIPPVISDKNQGIHDILLKTVVVKGKLAKVN